MRGLYFACLSAVVPGIFSCARAGLYAWLVPVRRPYRHLTFGRAHGGVFNHYPGSAEADQNRVFYPLDAKVISNTLVSMKLTRRFYLYIISLFSFGLLAFFYLLHLENERLLQEAGLMDARRLANAFFGELYTSMALGGGAENDKMIVQRYKNIEGVMAIKAIHGAIIDNVFGVEADEVSVDEFERDGLNGMESWSIMESGRNVQRSMRLVMPIRIEQRCIGCHEAPEGSTAGAISLRISLARYEAIVAGHERYMLLVGLLILVFASISILVALRRRLLNPLFQLKEGLESIRGGDLSGRLSLNTGDEFDDVGLAFNEMAKSLEVTSSNLHEAILKYSSLVEMATDAIFLVDTETMKVMEANKAAVLLTGFEKEELSQMVSTDFYETSLPRKAYVLSFKRWVFDGKGYAFDTVIRKKQGSAVYVDIAASTVEINGRTLILEIWRDISERKCLEDGLRSKITELEGRVRERTEELETAYDKLKASQQKIIHSAKLISLGEMGAGIAHELNSPLAGILTIVEVLLGRMDTEDRNYTLLEKIKDAAVRSKYIIIDMLSYARPFQGDMEPLNLNEVVKSTLSLFVSEVNAASVDISLDLGGNLPVVMGARGQLMEVIFNLVKNARDSIADMGGITLRTRTMDEDGALFVVAEIKDTGEGIPDEILERVFDPFFSTKDKGGGLNVGLGLSISESIIKKHGGRLEAKNLSSGGAMFSIILPAITSGPECGGGDKI